MPWRLIGFICVFVIFLIFIGFNLGEEYRCDINFGFKVIEDIPVFYTIFVSFTLGFLCTLPVVLGARKKRKDASVKEKGKKDIKTNNDDSAAVAQEFNEPAPSYSGGKYFDKSKFKKKK